MQEEVDEKTVALVINGGKISANILKNAIEKLLQKIDEKNRIRESDLREEKKAQKAKAAAKKEAKKEAKKNAFKPGKKTMNEMMRDGSKLSTVPVSDSNIKSFDKVARKYCIDYSLKKDKSTDPPKYIVFFRARDSKVMEAALREYADVRLPKERRASIRTRLRKAISISAKHRERAKAREKSRQPEL